MDYCDGCGHAVPGSNYDCENCGVIGECCINFENAQCKKCQGIVDIMEDWTGMNQ